MARIRTIKPEFWDSPSTASASPWARLLFIAMWNWADDYGRGTANLKELEGFAFPNDDRFTDSSGNTVHFRELVAEVSECFGVVFYTVDNRPYFAIPTWEEHQRNERRAKQSKFPDPPASSQVSKGKAETVAEIPCKSAEIPNSSGTGTGEQGNRGTGEQKGSVRKRSALKKEPSPEEQHITAVATAAYEAINKSAKFIGLRQIAKWCVNDRGLDADGFRQAVVAVYEMGKPITKQVIGQYLDGHLNRSGPMTFDQQRIQANNDLFMEIAGSVAGGEAWTNDSFNRQIQQ